MRFSIARSAIGVFRSTFASALKLAASSSDAWNAAQSESRLGWEGQMSCAAHPLGVTGPVEVQHETGHLLYLLVGEVEIHWQP